MARAIWSGSISFGLVNVPVKAFTAVRDHTVHFHQLDPKSGSRVRQELVVEKTGRKIERSDTVLGYEIKEGRYVTFERDELDDLRPASTRAVEISDFVSLADIDPIYYERTYWLAPADDEAKKAYALLLAAMEDRDQAAVGTVVMRNKQYLTAIRPLDGVLAMSTMRFADEVVARSDIDELPSRRTQVDAKAKKLALQIVDSLAGDWDPKQYHDTYTEQLTEIIERKDKGEEAVVDEAPSQTAEVVDLMAALQASVAAARKSGGRAAQAKALAKAAEELAEEAVEDEPEDADETKTKRARSRSASRSSTGSKGSTSSKSSKTSKAKPRKAAAGRKPAKAKQARKAS